MPSPELTADQREALKLAITPEYRAAVLGGLHSEFIQHLGEEVLVDALRLRPSIRDVIEAPTSFRTNCERLVNIAPNTKTAFRIVGEAVALARNYTKQSAFMKEK